MGVALLSIMPATLSMDCKGTFLLPGIWPSRYSSGVRTSSRTAPGVALYSLTPSPMSGPFRKSKNPISMSSSQHGQNLRLGLRTHRFIGKFAVLHHHKGGDAHDAELRGQFRRSEEHTSELQSPDHLVFRLL